MSEPAEDRPGGQATAPRREERRKLWDRRSPIPRRSEQDRRRGDRRRGAAGAAKDRRAGNDRRREDRRAAAERRGQSPRRRDAHRSATPIPYTAAEAADLRSRFAAPGLVECPACGGSFTLGPARRGGGGGATERLVLCTGCGRAAVVHDTRATRVLVVSGMTPLRTLLRDMLVNAGHEVIEVDDAAVGLGAFETLPADVVLLDVVATGRLPAPEFLKRLRASQADPRVVALAGRPSYAGADPLTVVQGLGELPTLRVPISRESLLKAVQDVRA
jgi:CheY-like chemotaxis protein